MAYTQIIEIIRLKFGEVEPKPITDHLENLWFSYLHIWTKRICVQFIPNKTRATPGIAKPE